MDSWLIRPATSLSSIQVFVFHNDLGKSWKRLLSISKYKMPLQFQTHHEIRATWPLKVIVLAFFATTISLVTATHSPTFPKWPPEAERPKP